MTREKLLRLLVFLYMAALVVTLASLLPKAHWRHLQRSKASGSLAIVHVYGVINTRMSPSTFGAPDADSIASTLHRLSKDDDVKAILIRINSPGGTVGAVQQIHEEILRCKTAGKVVVASLGDVAASGGYYLASACDKVYAEPGSIVGSIGVILEFGNLQGLMQKLGVRLEVIKSGPFKDVGSPARPLTAEERDFLQKTIDNAYGQFVDAVTQGRHMPREKILALADGRIFTGQQSKGQGLVDELGNWRDAEDAAIRLARLPENPTIVSDAAHGLSGFMRQIASEHGGSALETLSSAWPQGPRLEYRWQ